MSKLRYTSTSLYISKLKYISELIFLKFQFNTKIECELEPFKKVPSLDMLLIFDPLIGWWLWSDI